MRGLCLALLLPAAAAGGQAPPTFRSEIGLVVIQATVRNERGEAVTGLERGDFTVYENGARQTITSFRDGEAPISLGLLLDHSRSMRDGRPAVEAAARAALTATRPPDETFLMNFADTLLNGVSTVSKKMPPHFVHGAGMGSGSAVVVTVRHVEQSQLRLRRRPRERYWGGPADRRDLVVANLAAPVLQGYG